MKIKSWDCIVPNSSNVQTFWLQLIRHPVDWNGRCWYVVLSLSLGSVGGVIVILYRHHIGRILNQWRRSITSNLAIVTSSWELLRDNWDLAVELVGFLRDNSEFVGALVNLRGIVFLIKKKKLHGIIKYQDSLSVFLL